MHIKTHCRTKYTQSFQKRVAGIQSKVHLNNSTCCIHKIILGNDCHFCIDATLQAHQQMMLKAKNHLLTSQEINGFRNKSKSMLSVCRTFSLVNGLADKSLARCGFLNFLFECIWYYCRLQCRKPNITKFFCTFCRSGIS